MCACRYGIPVYLKDGKVRYIEGNRHHPVATGCVTVSPKLVAQSWAPVQTSHVRLFEWTNIHNPISGSRRALLLEKDRPALITLRDGVTVNFPPDRRTHQSHD